MFVFWNVTPCSVAEVYLGYRAACCLNHRVTIRQNYSQTQLIFICYKMNHTIYNIQCIDVNNNSHTVYCILYGLPYNKKEYNLMMADIEAETCSCWQLCEPPIANKCKVCLTVLLPNYALMNTTGMSPSSGIRDCTPLYPWEGQCLTFYSLVVTWCTTSLTFNNCTFCPHCIYVFCIYLRKNNDLCHLQHKLIGFYNPYEECLLRCTDWVFK
jgi:hypothetical protein